MSVSVTFVDFFDTRPDILAYPALEKPYLQQPNTRQWLQNSLKGFLLGLAIADVTHTITMSCESFA